MKAGKNDMKTTTQPFAIHIPDANGESTERVVSIDVPLRWDEMIDEWVLTEEAHEMIDRRKALEMGLLSPAQLRELRERHKQNQKQMGMLFQVGEKSWSRWESGKHRPTRSINLLIRALYDGEISIDYLRKRAGLAGGDGMESTWIGLLRSGSFREIRSHRRFTGAGPTRFRSKAPESRQVHVKSGLTAAIFDGEIMVSKDELLLC